MRYRVQTLLLLTAIGILLTGCEHANALVSVRPSPKESVQAPDLADIPPFDEAFAPFLENNGSGEDCILVRNKSQVLLDTCVLSDDKIAALCSLLVDSQPVSSHDNIKVADRGYRVEWSHGDHMMVIQSGTQGDQKYTLIWLDDLPYHTNYTVYTEWIESFATPN
jgi:hypothetical protein